MSVKRVFAVPFSIIPPAGKDTRHIMRIVRRDKTEDVGFLSDGAVVAYYFNNILLKSEGIVRVIFQSAKIRCFDDLNK